MLKTIFFQDGGYRNSLQGAGMATGIPAAVNYVIYFHIPN